MENKFEVNTKLALFDYLAMVREIAYEFFNDEDGTYQPQIGKLNAMRLFYNYCVTKSVFDEKYKHDVTDADSMAEIVENEGFIEAFNDAINCDDTIQYDFGNAYRDAIEIVNAKKTSIGNAVNSISATINKLIKNTAPLVTEENINVVSQIAKDMAKGKTSAEAIVNAYANRLEKTNNTEMKDKKVIPFNKQR